MAIFLFGKLSTTYFFHAECWIWGFGSAAWRQSVGERQKWEMATRSRARCWTTRKPRSKSFVPLYSTAPSLANASRKQHHSIIWYTVSWKYEGVDFRELFAPVRGNLKPDIPSVREILFTEQGVRLQGQWWQTDEKAEPQSEDDKSAMCLIAWG